MMRTRLWASLCACAACAVVPPAGASPMILSDVVAPGDGSRPMRSGATVLQKDENKLLRRQRQPSPGRPRAIRRLRATAARAEWTHRPGLVCDCMPRLTSFWPGRLDSCGRGSRACWRCRVRTAAVGPALRPLTRGGGRVRRRIAPGGSYANPHPRPPPSTVLEAHTHPMSHAEAKDTTVDEQENGPMPLLCIRCFSLDTTRPTRPCLPLLICDHTPRPALPQHTPTPTHTHTHFLSLSNTNTVPPPPSGNGSVQPA